MFTVHGIWFRGGIVEEPKSVKPLPPLSQSVVVLVLLSGEILMGMCASVFG